MALYAADGSFNVTVVDGSAITGVYAADGSFNVYIVDGTTLTGLYHPCGAYNVYLSNGDVVGATHPCGAAVVSIEPYVPGTMKVSGLGATISLSATSIAEDAADNSVVGTLSVVNGSGTYTFSIEVGDDPDDKFAISGDDLIIDELLDYETAASHLVTVTADNGVDTPITRQFTITVLDVPAPTITSSDTVFVDENATLAHSLTAGESVTWSIVGGADQALFDISSDTLIWDADGTQDYEDPQDADTNNAYLVTVRATSASTGETTDQNITVTVDNVIEAPVFTVAPVVAGPLDGTLASTTGTLASPDGDAATFAYQWKDAADDSNLTGETASTLDTQLYIGLEVYCTVTATNSADSTSEDSNTVGPLTEAPTVPAAFEAGDWTLTAADEHAIVTINSLPDDGGSAITNIEYRLDGGSWTSSGGTTTFSITGLTNTVEYDVELRAVNAIGAGAASDVKQVTPGVDETPAAVVLTWASAETDTTPDFDVDLPDGLGAPHDAEVDDVLVIQYRLQSGDDGDYVEYLTDTLDAGEVAGDEITVSSITPLSNGEYYFRARLERDSGTLLGPWSNVESVTIAAVGGTDGWELESSTDLWELESSTDTWELESA